MRLFAKTIESGQPNYSQTVEVCDSIWLDIFDPLFSGDTEKGLSSLKSVLSEELEIWNEDFHFELDRTDSTVTVYL